MAKSCLLILLVVLFPIAICNEDLASIYPFNVTLVADTYWLYWNFNHTTQNISFAVRVKTTGWIGFGLSPNGQMPGSDVVIGWVDGTNYYFHDRYAFMRRTPPIDPIQNWFLTSAVQSNGYTTLQFYRNFTSCDELDLDILYQTAHIVYSWNDNKPTVTTHSNGTQSYTLIPHSRKGSTSVNLLGGLPNPPRIPQNVQAFTVNVSQVTIPSKGTTYWCEAMRLPQSVIQTKRYIVKTSPSINNVSEPYVHHILIFLCNDLEESDLGPGAECFTNPSRQRVDSCTSLSGTLLAGWAVGGSDFIYPDNVAFPIGAGDYEFAVIEMHYNNPNGVQGVVDSSGVTFSYIDTPRQYDAGIITFGQDVRYTMVIPPNTPNFTTYGICPTACTQSNIPAGGLHIFANLLHTHLAGVGAVLHHVNTVDCDGTKRYQDLAPIEKNLNYDFNFQQTNHLPNEIIVQPGDTLILECIYNTVNRTGVTTGGLSTQEEMCLSFASYYPRITNDFCISTPRYDQFSKFITEHVPSQHQPAFNNSIFSSKEALTAAMNLLDWTQEQIDGYQKVLYTDGSQYSYCGSITSVTIPSVCCSYETNNTCTGYVPSPCCQRECSGANTFSFSIALLVITVILGMMVAV